MKPSVAALKSGTVCITTFFFMCFFIPYAACTARLSFLAFLDGAQLQDSAGPRLFHGVFVGHPWLSIVQHRSVDGFVVRSYFALVTSAINAEAFPVVSRG